MKLSRHYFFHSTKTAHSTPHNIFLLIWKVFVHTELMPWAAPSVRAEVGAAEGFCAFSRQTEAAAIVRVIVHSPWLLQTTDT